MTAATRCASLARSCTRDPSTFWTGSTSRCASSSSCRRHEGCTGSEKEELLKGIERVKWFLWHGNVIRADDTLYDLLEEIDGVREQEQASGPAALGRAQET